MAAFFDWITGLVIGKGLNDQYIGWKAKREQQEPQAASVPEEENAPSPISRDTTEDPDLLDNTTQDAVLPILPCGSEAHVGIVMPEPNFQSTHSHYTTRADHINLETGEPISAVKAYKHAPLDITNPISVQPPPTSWPLSFERPIPRKACDLETLSLPDTPKMAHSRHLSAAEEVLKNAREQLAARVEEKRRASRPAHQLPPALPDSLARPMANLTNPELIEALEELNEPTPQTKKAKLAKPERKAMGCAPRTVTTDKDNLPKPKRKVAKRAPQQ